jgi:hypothetical protein
LTSEVKLIGKSQAQVKRKSEGAQRNKRHMMLDTFHPINIQSMTRWENSELVK